MFTFMLLMRGGGGGRRKVALCLTLSIFRIDPTYGYLIQSETPDLDRFWCQNKEKKCLLLCCCERRRRRKKKSSSLFNFVNFQNWPHIWVLNSIRNTPFRQILMSKQAEKNVYFYAACERRRRKKKSSSLFNFVNFQNWPHIWVLNSIRNTPFRQILMSKQGKKCLLSCCCERRRRKKNL